MRKRGPLIFNGFALVDHLPDIGKMVSRLEQVFLWGLNRLFFGLSDCYY